MMTINRSQRAKLWKYMVLNESELKQYSNLIIAEKASEALGFKISNYTVEHIRMDLFPKTKNTNEKKANRGVLMDQIKELRSRIEFLEQELGIKSSK